MQCRALAAVFVIAAAGSAAADPGMEFFEKKIRPVLVEHCYQCHSAEAKTKKKLKAGLYVDSKAGLAKGGDSGPAVVAGKPAESPLIQALHGDPLSLMPPKGKLPAAVIADFEAWVKMGAPDPRTGTGKATEPKPDPIAAGRNFWAYKPPVAAAAPAVRDAAWPASDVDRFVLARLEAAGLKPSPDADRATLIRRLYFDLVGLPPSPEEIDAFVADPAPDAYGKLVDRLLASPQFGERWGRHWLDVARYAESLTLRGFVLKDAWRYRDYVIESFNRDVPFDRFVREQIAGDLLPAGSMAERRRNATAVTFLLMGNTNLEEQDKKMLRMDVVDEQLDVITKGFLAQTVTCARCHDHKFDPIPTKDYYALAGILRNVRTLEHANVSKWIEKPLPVDPALEAELKKHEAAVAALQARIKTEKAKLVSASRSKMPKAGMKTAGGVLAVGDVPGIVVDESGAKKVGEWKASRFSGVFIGEGYAHDMDSGKGEKTLTFHPELPGPGRYEVLFAYSPGKSRADNVPVTILTADGEKVVTVNQQKDPPLDGRYVSLGQFRFESKEQGYVIVSNEGTKGHVTADAVVYLPLDKPKPSGTPAREADPSADAAGDTLKQLEAELKKLEDSGPKRETVLALVEESKIEDCPIHIRGSVGNLGEAAPRGFLQVAAYGELPKMPGGESGRRELADWLASRNNPLTARVFVNRAWHWLFGAGLVRTVDNFGTTGETPSHPELLDALALRFMDEGWSVKTLVRSLVMSRTYRQAFADDAKAAAADPENRLLWRAGRRRLEAECLRDAMLRISGRLDAEMGGPGFPKPISSDYGYKHSDTRRSVYVPVFRNALSEVLEVFDFADTSMVTGRRDASTVASQALLMMNHPFVLEQASAAADRLLAEKPADDAAAVVRAYRLTLNRPPTEAEAKVALRHLAGSAAAGSAEKKAAWAMLFQALFASVEFRYVN
jgi:cytochrome c553